MPSPAVTHLCSDPLCLHEAVGVARVVREPSEEIAVELRGPCEGHLADLVRHLRARPAGWPAMRIEIWDLDLQRKKRVYTSAGEISLVGDA
jgi:hypothetical protein